MTTNNKKINFSEKQDSTENLLEMKKNQQKEKVEVNLCVDRNSQYFMQKEKKIWQTEDKFDLEARRKKVLNQNSVI